MKKLPCVYEVPGEESRYTNSVSEDNERQHEEKTTKFFGETFKMDDSIKETIDLKKDELNFGDEKLIDLKKIQNIIDNPHSNSSGKKKRNSTNNNSGNLELKLTGINEETKQLKTDIPSHKDTISVNDLQLKFDFNDNPNNINFSKVFQYFSSLDYSNIIPAVKVEDLSHMNCFKRFCFKCSKQNKLKDSLLHERQLIFCFSKTNYEEDNKIHLLIMKHIYKFLLNEREEEKQNWPKIGFQTSPNQDLRATGMFSPLQLLYMIDEFPSFISALYSLCVNVKIDWIFYIILIQFNKISLDMLREGFLISYCNQNNSVIKALNLFFGGLLYYFYIQIKMMNENHKGDISTEKVNEISAEKVNEIVEEIRKEAYKYPRGIFIKNGQLKMEFEIL